MSYKRVLEAAQSHRDIIARIVKTLTDRALLDVVDCEKVLADGLSRVSDNAGVRAAGVTRPTESAALRLAGREERVDDEGEVLREAEPDWWEEHERDVVADAINELLGSLAEAAGALKRVERKLPVVLDAGSRLKGRSSSVGECICCNETVTGAGSDRLKAGLCPRCYTACQDVGMPERAAFLKARKEWLDRRKRWEPTQPELPSWPRFWESWPDIAC